MSHFTLDDLDRMLRTCAGPQDTGGITDANQDVPLNDLGYDSLALLAAAAQVEHELGVRLPDEVIGELRTPHQFVAAVGRRLAPAR
jgi:act minimal PKS acyl carrier protein